MNVLVNRGHSKGSRSPRSNARQARQSVPLKDLFAAVGGVRPNRGGAGHMSKGARARMSVLAQMRPRDGLGRFLRTNRGKSRGRGRTHHNPLVANPLVANPLVANPLVANRGHHRGRGRPRHNPDAGSALAPFARSMQRVPVFGGVLAGAVMGVGSALAGAVGVLPTHFALRYASKWIPGWMRPVAFSATGVLLGGLIRVLGKNMPMAHELAVAVAASGGAVDAYRALHGQSANLAGDYDGVDGMGGEYGELGDLEDPYAGGEWGDADLGDLDDGFGDAGDVHSAEWGDTSLADAFYSGDDFSGAEIQYGELGRRAFRRRFHPKLRRGRRPPPPPPGGGGEGGEEGMEESMDQGPDQGAESEFAGLPGARWGWMNFWLGHDNVKAIMKMDPPRRKAMIQKIRHAAHALAEQVIKSGVTDGSLKMNKLKAAGLLQAA